MTSNQLFELRGKLSSQNSLILTLVGVVLVVALWWGLAEWLAKPLVTQDDSIRVEDLSPANRRFYESDSLLFANLDELEVMPAENLAAYGLTRRMVYPLLPTPVKVLQAFPDLLKDDDLVGNTLFSIKLNFLGYLLAIGVAIPLGFLLGLVPLFRGMFSKMFESYRFIPLTAVTGIFIMWLGLGAQM